MPYALGDPFTFNQETQIILPEPWTVVDGEKKIEGPSYQYANQVKGYGEGISVSYSYDLKEEFLEGEMVPEFLTEHEKIKKDLMFTLTYNPGIVTGEKSNLSLFMAAVLLILGTIIGLKIFRNFNPKPWIYAENKTIGGWLILPTIGLIITPIRILNEFFTTGFLDKSLWVSASNLGITETIAFELTYNILFFTFSLLMLILFYFRIFRLYTMFKKLHLLLFLGCFISACKENHRRQKN